jgi:hypothetical protein
VELIVAGFHRSGTSMVTQLLQASGLFVGEVLVEALPSNPYGHFEDREVLEIHRGILDDNGVGWQVARSQPLYIDSTRWRQMERFVAARQSSHRQWGFKDPRVCPFLGAWKYLLPDAKILVVFRDPVECVRSLKSRHAREYFEQPHPTSSHLNFFHQPDLAFRLWDTHNRALVAFARRHVEDCLVLDYAQIAADYPLTSAINHRLGFTLDEIPVRSVFDPLAAGRREHPQVVHDPTVVERVRQTWRELEELVALTEVPR